MICNGTARYRRQATELATEWGIGDHTRIAPQRLPAISFIGEGAILHAKGRVSGLPKDATLFVVASIGITCYGGLYLLAIFATMLLFLALHLLGWLERRFNLTPVMMNYMIEAR